MICRGVHRALARCGKLTHPALLLPCGCGARSLTFVNVSCFHEPEDCALSGDLAKVPGISQGRVTALNLLLSGKGWVPLLSL